MQSNSHELEIMDVPTPVKSQPVAESMGPHGDHLPESELRVERAAEGPLIPLAKEPAEKVPVDNIEQSGSGPPPSFYQMERRESVAIQILATLAVLLALYATRAIMLPIVFSVLLALTLRPVVRRLYRWGLPDIVGAGVTLAILVVILAIGVGNLINPARHWIETAPEQFTQLKTKLDGIAGQWKEIAATASQVKKIANGNSKDRPISVEIAQSTLSSNFAVISNTGNVFGASILVLGLSFFLLAWGDGLLNNVLHLLDTFSDKKRTVELVYDLERGIASYLLMVSLINLGLGVATGCALWLLGVPNAALWGVMATLLNYIPVFGALIGFMIVGVVSILSFDSLTYALVPPLTFIVLTAIESNLITPSILGKSMSLNPILVFVALIFWGWIWGVGGAFLAVPMLAVAKLACERFEKTRPFAVLMEA